MKTVLEKIQEQTQVSFMVNREQTERLGPVSLKAENETVASVLDRLLDNSPLTYVFMDRVIVIKERPLMQQPEGKEVRGMVKDEKGNPLPGVTVAIKGTNLGVVTDTEGKYQLRLPQEVQGIHLVFSFVGMKTQEIAYTGQQEINVTMKEEISEIDEVVVTGYQTLSKERVTGAYDLLPKKALDKPSSNIASRLVGRVAGVQATLDVNGDPTFQIRGKSSLYADAQPLVVVDGFPIEGDFKSINPNDVESITVLKDAAAASIWGARSANGVIVITTKNAKQLKKGDLRIELSSFVRFSPKTDLDYTQSRCSSADAIAYDRISYGKWRNDPIPDRLTAWNTGRTPGKIALNEHYLGYLTDAELEETLTRYAQQDNKDQIKKYILQNPFTHQHNASISSASERSRHFLSLMYEGRDLNLKGNEGKKFSVNYKTNLNVYKWLDADFSAFYMQDRATNNSTGIPNIAPYEMLVDENGKRLPVVKTYYMPNIERYVPTELFPYTDWTYNPITETENRNLTTTTNRARFQGGINIKLIDGLTFNTALKYELNHAFTRNYYGEETFEVRYLVNFYTYWNQTDNTFTLNIPKGAFLDQSRRETDVLNWRYQFNLNRSFGKHTVAAVVGSEITNKKIQNFGYTRTYGYNDETLSVGTFPNGLGSYTNSNLSIKNWLGTNITIYTGVNNSFSYSTNRFFSFYGNASYTYDHRYTISASARTDASNLITDDPKYRYQPMWSVGASWLVTKEKFIQEKEWIDRLVVRMTYGYNGNVDNSTSFKPLISVNATNDLYTQEPYARISSFGNPALRWEKTGVFNLGIDYDLWHGKLNGKIDYYRKSAKDLIAKISIPSVNGTKSQKINAANMVNNGIELEIGTSLPVARELVWEGNLNVAYNKNKVTKLFRTSYTHSDLIPWQSGITAFVEGKNANTIFGLKYAGLKNVGTEASPDWQPQIADKDGNLYGMGTWPSGDPVDYCYEQGTTVAPWILGFSNSFTYKNLEFSFILTGKFGHVFRRESYNYKAQIPNAKIHEVLNGNPDKIMPLPQKDNESRYYFWDRFWQAFTYLTESANHVRMQEITLTYRIPEKFLNRIGIRSAQFYGMANNVFSIYANKFKEDPEFPRGSLKPAPYFTFGVKIGL